VAISLDTEFIKQSAVKSRFLNELAESVESSQRAFCEGRLAGYDGISALHNPYARGELRFRWFDGYTEGKAISMGKS
jgi:ribosome modulation factor